MYTIKKLHTKLKHPFRYLLFGVACLLSFNSVAQETKPDEILSGPSMWGTTGLIAMSTPVLNPGGTIMLGGNFLPKKFFEDIPSWKKKINSGNYYLNMTILPFWELQLRFTLMKLTRKGYENKWNQDRSISTKFKILTEKGKYRPSLAIGMEDITIEYPFTKGNDFFTRVYLNAGKHWSFKAGTLGTYLNMVVARNKDFLPQAGVAFSPRCIPELTTMAEYDGKGLNAGIRYRLLRYVSLSANTYHFEAFTAGAAVLIDINR